MKAAATGIILLLLSTLPLPAQPIPVQGDQERVPFLPAWNFMSLSSGRVDSFLLEHPDWDGRGVVVLIFDTGVDPSIPGLGRSSTGGRKVVDLVDVSGSNVVRTRKVSRDGDEVESGELGITLRSLSGLSPAPYDSALYLGVVEESAYRNATVRDFDGDGESASRFGLLLYNSVEGPRVVVDSDADGSLAGETVLASYRDRGEVLLFPQRMEGEESPITAGASIDYGAKEVSFHYDMNGHGTHVAGIVSGFAINDEIGFNGVAPGVEIISVKFSSDPDDDLTITGTMRRAFEYAAHLADSLEAVGTPVVVNMSFGIGSIYEGASAMEEYLDELIPQHPNLYVVTSAGNSGPGLSSIGLPAAADQVITVGAALPVGIGRDSYGAAIDEDIIWDFSSRGGEVDKPDVVAPGTAISTIPRFSWDMRASGTSMASPYTAGVVALLLSAARQEYPGWIPGQGLIRRALRASARPLDGYAPIEQGGGMVDVIRAWEILVRWKESGYVKNFQEYDISTFSPGYPDGTGPAAYWRSTWVPGEGYRQEYTVTRRPVEAYAQPEGTEFFRPYTLESTVPWMEPIQKNVYIRGNDAIDIEVLYDREEMTQPGLYSGKIVARRARGDRKTAADEVEFELLSTVIVPWTLSPENDYRMTTGAQEIPAGRLDRHYLAVPEGAFGLRMRLRSEEGNRGNASGTIIDRFGEISTYIPGINTTDRTVSSALYAAEDLGDGVIEIVIAADAMEGAGGRTRYSLEVEAIMLDLEVETFSPGPQKESELMMTVQNTGTEPIEGRWRYTLKGYQRTFRDTIRSAEVYRRPIMLGAWDGALWVEVSFPPEVYQRSTDILIRLVDSTGASQAQEALNTPSEWLFLPNFYKDGVARGYFLEVVFGAAEPFDETTEPVTFTVLEKHVRPTDPEPIGSRTDRTLYPYIPRTLRGPLPKLEGGIPGGFRGIGEIRYEVAGSEETIVVEFIE